jgi:threonine/homoserine/homoserine lactone efflux protein
VSFSSLLTGSLWKTLASAAVLATIGFAAVSTWAVIGAGLSRLLTKKLYRTLFDVVMALLLLYSAVSIILH